jgi:HNH endonuclease
MRKPSRQFVFQRVYDMAAMVEECIENEGSLIELDWEDPQLLRGLAKFSKISILHRYIYAMIAVEHRYEYRKNADMYEAEDAGYIERLFDAYSINYLSYAAYTSPIPIEEARSREEDPFYQWVLTQEPSFEKLWEKLTDEVFHLLFGNRAFLLKFNRAVARYLEQGTIRISTEYLGSDGKLRRQPIPTWVRDAVYFRDHGRCVLCQVDLSGLLSTDRSEHFDHMVPLAAWGINDPCNIQLLCETCNLKKADGEPTTGHRYSPWWSY